MLRLLVPTGFMIAADAHGAPSLVLCDGVAGSEPVVRHTMHAPHHGAQHDPVHRHEAPCPYAALAAPVLPPLPATFAPPAAALVAPAPALRAASFAHRGPAAAPPPSTGPPSTA